MPFISSDPMSNFEVLAGLLRTGGVDDRPITRAIEAVAERQQELEVQRRAAASQHEVADAAIAGELEYAEAIVAFHTAALAEHAISYSVRDRMGQAFDGALRGAAVRHVQKAISDAGIPAAVARRLAQAEGAIAELSSAETTDEAEAAANETAIAEAISARVTLEEASGLLAALRVLVPTSS